MKSDADNATHGQPAALLNDQVPGIAADAGCQSSLTTAQFIQQAFKSSSLAQLLTLFCDQVFSLAQVDGCIVSLLKDSGTTLVSTYLRLPEEFSDIRDTLLGFQHRLHQYDVNAIVLKEGLPRLVCKNDLHQYGNATRLRFERFKMHSLVVVPLMVRQADGNMEALGTVSVYRQDHILEGQSAQRIFELGELCAAQIALHWRYQQSVERSKAVESMYGQIQQFIANITRMNSLTAVDEVYESIGQEFIGRFNFDLVNILLSDQNGLKMVHSSFSAPFAHLQEKWEPYRQRTQYSFDIHDGQSAVIFASNQRFAIDDTLKVMHLPMSDKDKEGLALLETPRTFMIVPIRLNGAPIGIMWLITLGEPMQLPETELTLIDLLSSFISTAIINAKAHGLVEQQNIEIAGLNRDLQNKMQLLDQVARRDRLTGLNNFGNFDEELKRRTNEATRAINAPLSLILFDIDHFKKFNDTWGHPAGNEILQAVAVRLLKCVREMDFPARYGGEEFAVILPQCAISDAQAIAERIRSVIADEAFIANGGQHSVTVSVGYAQFLAGESAGDFICRVDAALYEAKRSGRNRIHAAIHSSQAMAKS
jgi:two-component system cell cycle response regulator